MPDVIITETYLAADDGAPGEEPGQDMVQRMSTIGASVVADSAADVDRTGRFPVEAIEAMRAEELLSVLVPRSSVGQAPASRRSPARWLRCRGSVHPPE